jgi:Spore Coat Protein U domain
MKLKSVQYVLALLLVLMASANAWAQATCSVVGSVGSVVNYSPTYLPTATTNNVMPMSFSVVCQRGSNGNNSVVVGYKVTADNGMFPSSIQNKAKNPSGNFLNYELGTDANCAVEFQGTGVPNSFSGSVTLAKNQTSSAMPHGFTGCIPKQQVLATPGTYSDTVALTVTVTAPGSGTVTNGSGSVNVAIATPVTCTLSRAPDNISLNYTAFQGSAARQNTLFRATCSGGLAYTMKITNSDNTALVTNAVAAGINYSLGVSAAVNGPPANPLTGTVGTGTAIDGYIIVTAPANQAGSCSGGCSKTNTHYLTLEY